MIAFYAAREGREKREIKTADDVRFLAGWIPDIFYTDLAELETAFNAVIEDGDLSEFLGPCLQDILGYRSFQSLGFLWSRGYP